MKIKKENVVSWSIIRDYFRPSDITCMKRQGIDLSDCKAVGDHSSEIYNMLNIGRMPPDGKWPQNQIDDFKSWMDAGCSCL